MLRLFFLSFMVSLGVGYLILRWDRLHVRYTGDVAIKGSFKVHAGTVSRIGGLGILIGLLAGVAASGSDYELPNGTILIWLLCLLPAFVGGLAHDLSKRVPTIMRVLAACLSAGLAYLLLDAAVPRVDIPGIDPLLAIPAVSFLFTVFAVGLLAHAMNTIDGLHGLMSGVCVSALFALGWVASEVDDREILLMCGLGVGAVLGFLVWNFPSGRIFAGDGGAYFLGAYVAILSVLLVQRQPDVSPWFPLLLVLYPVWETIFSVYRRRVLRGVPASRPDRLHIHTLVYKRVKPLPTEDGAIRTRRNCDASVSMLLFASYPALPAVLWWNETLYLLASALGYVIVYLAIYRRLVRFGARQKKRSNKLSLAMRRAAIRRSR